MTGSSGLAIICCLLEWHDPPFQKAWYAGAFMKGTWTTIVVTYLRNFWKNVFRALNTHHKSHKNEDVHTNTNTWHCTVIHNIIYLTILCSSQANSSQFKLKWRWFTKYASFNHSQNISQKYFRMDNNSKNNSHKLHICIFFFFNQRNQYRNPDVSWITLVGI